MVTNAKNDFTCQQRSISLGKYLLEEIDTTHLVARTGRLSKQLQVN